MEANSEQGPVAPCVFLYINKNRSKGGKTKLL